MERMLYYSGGQFKLDSDALIRMALRCRVPVVELVRALRTKKFKAENVFIGTSVN